MSMGMNFKDIGGKLDGFIGMVGMVSDMAMKSEPKAAPKTSAGKTKAVEDLRLGETIVVDNGREFTVTQAPSLNGYNFVVVALRGATQTDAYLTMPLGTEVRLAD